MGVLRSGFWRRFCRKRCLPALRRVAGPPTALLMLVLLIVLNVVLLLLKLPEAIVSFLTWPIVANFNLIVEHAYSMSICKLHVTMGRWCRRRSSHAYHSRFADLRVDVSLLSGGRASVHLIPCLSDNFAYLIVDATAKPPRPSCLVDPADAYAVYDALPAIKRIHYNGEELDVQAILTTHRHWDHQGGNRDMPRLLPSVQRIYGGAADHVLGCTDELQHGQELEIGDLKWRVLAAPGHTRGSVTYHLLGAQGRGCLMTGDVLFCGGCGAPFEEYCGECARNLLTITRECTDETLIFPGHEYTSRLLERALTNKMSSSGSKAPGKLMTLVGARFMASHRRQVGPASDRLPTVPVSLGEERRLNPHFGYPLHKYARMVLSVLEAHLPHHGADGLLPGDPHAACNREAEAPMPAAGDIFKLTVDDSITSLGFTASPPPTAVVKSCAPLSWAEQQGVMPGDQLLSVNEMLVSHMSKADMGKLMCERPAILEFARSREKACNKEQVEVGFELDDAKVPEPIVLSHDRLPTANPFASLYQLDFERICGELETGKLTGGEAATELRAARRRLDDDVLHRHREPRHDPLPSKKDLQQALCVLGVPPEISIGREAAELASLPVNLPWLRANLISLCDKDRASSATAVLNSRWRGVTSEEPAPVDKVAAWLTTIACPPKQVEAACEPLQSLASDSAMDSATSIAPDSTMPEPPESAAPAPKRVARAPFGARLRRLGRRLACRCSLNSWHSCSIYERLLEEPQHDIANCIVCSNTFFGMAKGAGSATARGGEALPNFPCTFSKRSGEAHSLKAGSVVCVHGLQDDKHLNGLVGACVEQLDAPGEVWAVQLESGEVKSIDVENLMVSLGQTRIASRGSGEHFGPKITVEPPAQPVRLPSVDSSQSAPAYEFTYDSVDTSSVAFSIGDHVMLAKPDSNGAQGEVGVIVGVAGDRFEVEFPSGTWKLEHHDIKEPPICMPFPSRSKSLHSI